MVHHPSGWELNTARDAGAFCRWVGPTRLSAAGSEQQVSSRRVTQSLQPLFDPIQKPSYVNVLLLRHAPIAFDFARIEKDVLPTMAGKDSLRDKFGDQSTDHGAGTCDHVGEVLVRQFDR